MKIKVLSFFAICLFGLFSVGGHAQTKDLKVVILGDSGPEDGGRGFQTEIFEKLLRGIKKNNPDAVFYIGNLISGLEQNTSPAGIKAFQQKLNEFSKLVAENLGAGIPVYPIMGNQSLMNIEAVSIFRNHFKIVSTAPLEPYQLAYIAMLDNVQFVVLATGYYERKFLSYRQYQETLPILSWLEKVLRTGGNTIRYRFVIDHEPEFSPMAPAGTFTGLDRNVEKRDLFWNILRRNGVLAYFSANEAIFDRSNRGGVWQIITGGAGPSLPKRQGSYIFYHYVLLTIPKEPNKNPVMEVFDSNGTAWDKFELTPLDRPVYQLRISSSLSSGKFSS